MFSSRPRPLQRREDLADRPVDLHDHVAEQARAGLALELVGDEQRHVRHGVRQVEEERPVLVLLDELHGPLGVPGRQLRLVGRTSATICSPSISGRSG